MSIIKSQNARVMSEEAIQYLCKCINLVNSLPTSIIDNLHLADNLTFSSTKIDSLLTILKEDCNKYTDSIVANLSRLELRVVTDEADMIEHNKLYLIKKSGETSYSQYVIVTNDSGVDEKILLGTCDISMTDYLKISDADLTYCKKTDFDALKTEVDKVKTTVDGKVDKASILSTISDNPSDDKILSEKAIKSELDNLKTNFQDGVNTIYDSVVAKGVTPVDKSPSSIAKAINAIGVQHIELTSLVPIMTNDTSPSGKVIYSSKYSDEYVGYKAFNGKYTDCWHTASNTPNGWIGYIFEEPVVVTKFDLSNRRVNTSNVNAPKNFTLEASNTGEYTGEEVILGTYVNENNTSGNKTTYTVNNNTKYKSYRINISGAVLDGYPIAIAEITFYGIKYQ